VLAGRFSYHLTGATKHHSLVQIKKLGRLKENEEIELQEAIESPALKALGGRNLHESCASRIFAPTLQFPAPE
jgi:hypothetical protein